MNKHSNAIHRLIGNPVVHLLSHTPHMFLFPWLLRGANEVAIQSIGLTLTEKVFLSKEK